MATTESVVLVPEPLPVWQQVPEWVWVSVAVPLALAVLGHWAGWIRLGPEKRKADAAHDEVIHGGFAQLVADQRSELNQIRADQTADRQSTNERIFKLEARLERSDRRFERAHRIATRAVDLAEEQVNHLISREDARRRHDPEGRLMWVPDAPPHLLDIEMVRRVREDLERIAEDDHEEHPPRTRDPT